MIAMKGYVFDLDNTLIYTNLLNNNSYNHALNSVGLESIVDCKRITRDIIFSRYPNLNSIQKNIIIELKQRYFINNLKYTFPNKPLIQILENKNPKLCILWTSANKSRVLSILDYYKIRNEFKVILYSNKNQVIYDIVKICESLECDLKDLIFYEDNQRVIEELKKLCLNVISV